MLRTEITGVHVKVDDRLQKYITKKIGNLDRYVPRQARASSHAVVKIKQAASSDKRQYTCDIVLHVPIENIKVSESTVNMYAAVDIAEAKLRHALRRYKEIHGTPSLRRRIINRFVRQQPVE